MLGAWTSDLSTLSTQFHSAKPFPLLVIDDFLEPSAAEGLLAEFPSIESMPRSHDYVFGDKRESPTLDTGGTLSQQYRELLLSPEFAKIVSTLTGRSLFLDPGFHGGGFHQGGDGSYLDTHVDFNIHPQHEDWLRVLNILLYLNKDWPPEFGGDLLVRSDPKDEPRAVAPQFNRCVIMLTSDNTYHGYRRMTLPPGVTRKSIAAYAYERIPVGSARVRTTSWAPENAGIVKRTLARHWTTIAATGNRVRKRRARVRSGG